MLSLHLYLRICRPSVTRAKRQNHRWQNHGGSSAVPRVLMILPPMILPKTPSGAGRKLGLRVTGKPGNAAGGKSGNQKAALNGARVARYSQPWAVEAFSMTAQSRKASREHSCRE